MKVLLMQPKSTKSQHRIATLDYVRADNSSFNSDIQTFCQNWIPKSQHKKAAFFEDRAQPQLEAIITEVLERDSIVSLPALYEAEMLAGSDDET